MPNATKPGRFAFRAFQFRSDDTAEAGDGRTLEGYAAVFGTPTRISSYEGTFDEIVAPGAFRRTLRARTPVLQFDHGHDQRTGSVPIGAISDIREDDHGLFISARLFDNPVVEPIRQAIEGGAIDGMSFRFKINRDEWRDNAGKLVKASELLDLLWDAGERGPLVRTIKEVELYEAGPVVFPAYDSTSVGVRSLLAGLDPAERSRLVDELASALTARATAEHTDDEPAEDDVPAPEDFRDDADPGEIAATEPAEPGTSDLTTDDPTQRHSTGLSASARARALQLMS